MLPHLYFDALLVISERPLLRRQRDTAQSIFSREWHTRADRLAFRSVGLPRLDERNLLFLGASAPCPSLEPQRHAQMARHIWARHQRVTVRRATPHCSRVCL